MLPMESMWCQVPAVSTEYQYCVAFGVPLTSSSISGILVQPAAGAGADEVTASVGVPGISIVAEPDADPPPPLLQATSNSKTKATAHPLRDIPGNLGHPGAPP